MELRIRAAIFEYIDLAKYKRLRRAQFCDLRFDRVAETTSGLGEKYDFNHQGLERF